MNVRKVVSLVCLAGVVTTCTMTHAMDAVKAGKVMKSVKASKSITVVNETWENVVIKKRTPELEKIEIGPSGSYELSWNPYLLSRSVIKLELEDENDELTFYRKLKNGKLTLVSRKSMPSPKWENIGDTLKLVRHGKGTKTWVELVDNATNYQYEVNYKGAH